VEKGSPNKVMLPSSEGVSQGTAKEVSTLSTSKATKRAVLLKRVRQSS
jgi:hypothetical protein